MGEPGFGQRLRLARRKWNLTQDDLAKLAGIGVMSVIRGESGEHDLRLASVRKLADALFVRWEWLVTGEEPMASLAQMTVPTQFEVHTGPGTEGLPGFVVIDPGGPWLLDDDGEFQLDPAFDRERSEQA